MTEIERESVGVKQNIAITGSGNTVELPGRELNWRGLGKERIPWRNSSKRPGLLIAQGFPER